MHRNHLSAVTTFLLATLVTSSLAIAAPPIGSSPTWLGSMGNTLFFIARPALDPPGNAALFKSDGTTVGTIQVAQIDGFGVLTYPAGTLFIAADTKAYFLGNTTTDGQQVWVTDGTTAGTHQVANPYTGTDTQSPALLSLIGTDLVFGEQTTEYRLQLFRTDGTAAGTGAISNFAQNQYGRVIDNIGINGKIYVALDSGLSCCAPDLWATDGTIAGTVQIPTPSGPPWHLQPSSLRAFGDSVALITDDESHGSRVSTVATATNALTIVDAGPGVYSSTIAVMDGFILYLSGDASTGQQLWRSDGTVPGTVMVMDMGPGVQLSQLAQGIVITRVGSRAIFQSENAQDGPQLWGSDGTAQGTVPLIATPTPVGSGFVPPLLGVAGTHGYYAVYNGTDFRVVVTDGTVAGTHVLSDAGPIDPNSLPGEFIPGAQVIAGDDTLAFLYIYHLNAPGNTRHLYTYAPQPNSLTHLLDNDLADEASEPMLTYAGRLYFRGGDPVHSDNPWVSDGTVAGTHILVNLSNVAPIAGNDSANSASDAAVTINVLANDSESGGTIDTTSVQIISNPTHGDVSVTSSGSVVYTPASEFAGSDSFTYSVADAQGARSNVATVTVSVTSASSSGGGGTSGGGD